MRAEARGVRPGEVPAGMWQVASDAWAGFFAMLGIAAPAIISMLVGGGIGGGVGHFVGDYFVKGTGLDEMLTHQINPTLVPGTPAFANALEVQQRTVGWSFTTLGTLLGFWKISVPTYRLITGRD